MYSRLPAVKNASQIGNSPWILRGSLPKCQHFFSFPNRPISETLIFLPKPLPKQFYFIRKLSKSTS